MMKTSFRIASAILALSSAALILNLFDILTLNDTMTRVAGTVALVSLFITVYIRGRRWARR